MFYLPSNSYVQAQCLDRSRKYNTPYSEDFEMWWQLSRSYKIACLHEVLLDYRVTDESLCRTTKKDEYDTAQYAQVLRNIHYYTGYNYDLSYPEVECMRYNW